MPSVGEKAWTGFGNTAGRPSSPLRVGYFGALSLTGIVLCQQSTWWHCLLALWLLTFGETPGRSNRRLGLGETVAKADFLFVRINSSMSAIGTKRTCTGAPRMSAFGSKPDIGNYLPIMPLGGWSRAPARFHQSYYCLGSCLAACRTRAAVSDAGDGGKADMTGCTANVCF